MLSLNEFGFKHDYEPVEPTAAEAAQGAALITSTEWQEQVGQDMFANGEPISRCRTIAMRRGWEMMQRIMFEEMEAERDFWVLRYEGEPPYQPGSVTLDAADELPY